MHLPGCHCDKPFRKFIVGCASQITLQPDGTKAGALKEVPQFDPGKKVDKNGSFPFFLARGKQEPPAIDPFPPVAHSSFFQSQRPIIMLVRFALAEPARGYQSVN